jgi:hypothetical protein
MAVAKAAGLNQCREAVRREFTEQPGLRLTHPQAARLSGTSSEQCHRALEVLVEEGFLVVTSDGQYCRPDFGGDTDDGLE